MVGVLAVVMFAEFSVTGAASYLVSPTDRWRPVIGFVLTGSALALALPLVVAELRGRGVHHVGLRIAALTAIQVAGLAIVGSGALTMLPLVVVPAMLSVRWPFAVAMAAAAAIASCGIAYAFGDVGLLIWYPNMILARCLGVFVLVELLRAVHALESAREERAELARRSERHRMTRTLIDEVLPSISRMRSSLATTTADPVRLQDLSASARSTLTRVRATVRDVRDAPETSDP